ncbi:protein CUSTOS isoform X2 [Ambystoma mexicanum]
MAPPALTMQQDSDSESSEDLQHFREATWEVAPDTMAGATEKASTKNSSSCGAAQPSARFKADEHEQDGNELQTTPEFRTHVAKKLGAMLDSYICVSWDGTHQPSVAKEGADSEEDGFRLFFSSVPGCSEDVTPIPQKRQLPSSSSDSDEEWQRCQEAAISGTDILKHSAIPVPQLVPATATGKGATGDQGKKKKCKKKKKKAKVDGANGTVLVPGGAVTQVQQGCDPQDGGALDSGNLKRKKRKKRGSLQGQFPRKR